MAILDEFRQLKNELADINNLNKGVLRLGIPPMVGMMMAEPICRRLDKTNLVWLPLHSPLRWQPGMIWRRNGYLSRSARAWIRCCKAFWPVET